MNICQSYMLTCAALAACSLAPFTAVRAADDEAAPELAFPRASLLRLPDPGAAREGR